MRPFATFVDDLMYLNTAEDARCSPSVGVTSQTTDAAAAADDNDDDDDDECQFQFQLRGISVTFPRCY